jgi:hypothetical protein
MIPTTIATTTATTADTIRNSKVHVAIVKGTAKAPLALASKKSVIVISPKNRKRREVTAIDPAVTLLTTAARETIIPRSRITRGVDVILPTMSSNVSNTITADSSLMITVAAIVPMVTIMDRVSKTAIVLGTVPADSSLMITVAAIVPMVTIMDRVQETAIVLGTITADSSLMITVAAIVPMVTIMDRVQKTAIVLGTIVPGTIVAAMMLVAAMATVRGINAIVRRATTTGLPHLLTPYTIQKLTGGATTNSTSTTNTKIIVDKRTSASARRPIGNGPPKHQVPEKDHARAAAAATRLSRQWRSTDDFRNGQN